MARRLTKKEKVEIVNGYTSGESAAFLSNKHGCSPNTVIRTVKAMLPSKEYLALKESRSRESLSQKSSVDFLQGDMTSIEEICVSESNDDGHDANLSLNEGDEPSKESLIEKTELEVFQEIEPLTSTFGFDSSNQKVSCEYIDEAVLPEVVYMLVDKQVELVSKPLRELPEWSFLPEEEKNQIALSLFSNQRSAKRNCPRSQRVIKVPNSNVFLLTAHSLLEKGITRLVIEDTLISLAP